MEDAKTCDRCAITKPFADYQFQGGKPRATCRTCRSAASKVYKHSPENAERIKAKERERSAARSQYMRQWQRANAEKVNEWNRAKYCPVYFLVCAETAELFTARRPGAKYSKEGIRLTGLRYALRRNKEAKESAGPRECRRCKQQFQSAYGVKRHAYCSTQCVADARRAVQKGTKCHLRRARKFGVPYRVVDPATVFARDRWRCQLCGISTPKQKRGTMAPDAPELDHIIPLSQGGPHVYDNLQCACRGCNAAKGNALLGQTRLMLDT